MLPYSILTSSLDESIKTRLESLYHTGQKQIWDGKTILEYLTRKHPKVSLDDSKKESLKNILSMILWGEFVAWKMSADLAFDLDEIEAKLAATAQAHDEARHFYVMLDYLKLLDYKDKPLDKNLSRGLERVLKANTLGKKLLGMQLMVEPVAITIFSSLRKANVDPILTDLLMYYIQDESRHITLGTNYLPHYLEKASLAEKLNIFLWQLYIIEAEVKGISFLKKDFENLGIPTKDVFKLAELKQLNAFDEVAEKFPKTKLNTYAHTYARAFLKKYISVLMKWNNI
jgi:hypothetical protein